MPSLPAPLRRLAIAGAVVATSALTGCDALTGALGIESPEKVAAVREAEGKAIGGACRHAGRAIEDCYTLNKKSDKAAVFAGWREMNDYMRENKIDEVAPQLASGPAAPKPDTAAAAAADEAPAPSGGKAAKGEAPKAHAAKGHES